MIHILSTGKNTPIKYGEIELFRAEVHILEVIANNQGITATEITRKMDITKGAVSQIVIKLIKKGLIVKKEQADNLKVKELFLTPTGKEVNRYHALREKSLLTSLRDHLDILSDKEIRVFSKIVNRVSDYIEGE